MKEKLKIIGVFGLFNTGGICIHEIDQAEDRVLASMNGEKPKWCPITEQLMSEITGDEKDTEVESGFFYGSFLYPSLRSCACEERSRRNETYSRIKSAAGQCTQAGCL